MSVLRRLRDDRTLYWSIVALLALFVASTVWATLRSADAARAAWGDRIAVPVAVRDLAAGHRVGPGDVRSASLPPAMVPAPIDPSPIGRVVRQPILAGEVVVAARLGDAVVDEGSTGLAIPAIVAPAGLAAGTRVDLVLGADPFSGLESRIVAGATVVAADGDQVTVAVPLDEAPAIAAAVRSGSVSLALSGAR